MRFPDSLSIWWKASRAPVLTAEINCTGTDTSARRSWPDHRLRPPPVEAAPASLAFGGLPAREGLAIRYGLLCQEIGPAGVGARLRSFNGYCAHEVNLKLFATAARH